MPWQRLHPLESRRTSGKLTGRTFDWETVNSRRQEEIVRDLEHAGLLPGAGELIRNLAEAGTPMGVASSSSHRWVDGWLNRLGIMPYFKPSSAATTASPSNRIRPCS